MMDTTGLEQTDYIDDSSWSEMVATCSARIRPTSYPGNPRRLTSAQAPEPGCIGSPVPPSFRTADWSTGRSW